MNQQIGDVTLMPSRTYEVTFTGRAGSTLRAEFDDCMVAVGPATTTLRAELPDRAALSGLVQRITGLGLEVVHLHLVGLTTHTMTDLAGQGTGSACCRAAPSATQRGERDAAIVKGGRA
jgi:hypothetical protein